MGNNVWRRITRTDLSTAIDCPKMARLSAAMAGALHWAPPRGISPPRVRKSQIQPRRLMKVFYASVVFAVALVGLSSPALGAIQLIPVVTSGIASPTFVGHAGDGSNRLFILEQAG